MLLKDRRRYRRGQRLESALDNIPIKAAMKILDMWFGLDYKVVMNGKMNYFSSLPN